MNSASFISFRSDHYSDDLLFNNNSLSTSYVITTVNELESECITLHNHRIQLLAY